MDLRYTERIFILVLIVVMADLCDFLDCRDLSAWTVAHCLSEQQKPWWHASAVWMLRSITYTCPFETKELTCSSSWWDCYLLTAHS